MSGAMSASLKRTTSDSFARPFHCADGQKISLDAADFDPVQAMDMLLGEGMQVNCVR